MFGVGLLLPLQAGINASLRKYLAHPLWAGVGNFTVGLLAIVLIALLTRVPAPALGHLAHAPWWAWLGGLLGATLVVTSLIAAPVLGAALLIACLVGGQLVSSVVIDHMGWAGYPVKPIDAGRVIGVILLIAGVLLIQRSA